jgi:hypothetical protein
MKTNNLNNKDNNFSLYNVENYKKELTTSINEVVNNYFNLLVEYYKFIIENIKIKKKELTSFIIIRGLETITNVFLNLLLYTKNMDVTYFHCQRSFYFYVEFVGQISEDEKMFLQLTSRDASIYVYKKTIFEINSEFRKINENITQSTIEKFDFLNIYISLCKNYFFRVIKNNNSNKNELLLDLIKEILNKLNSNLVKIDKLRSLINIIDTLFNNIENVDFLFETSLCLVKKFIKNTNIVNTYENKNLPDDFINKVNEADAEKLVCWLFN